ncbi:MAG: Na(+)/H(+) antiporter subunit B [Bacillota bacterium]|nr:Na(+)/H(+) antiporter subunit B [Bacillota bacterium]
MTDDRKLPEEQEHKESAYEAARFFNEDAYDEIIDDFVIPTPSAPQPYTGKYHHIDAYTERHQVLEDGEEAITSLARYTGNLILTTVVSWVIYIILAFALYLFWNGHNAPGGGFIAGLMMAAVVVLMYVSQGSKFIKQTLRFDFKYLIGIGLLFALGCGLGGMFFGDPFLTHTFQHVSLPFFGDIELATATIFDFGVFLVVTGGCVTIITAIGESGSREQTIDIIEEAKEVATDDISLDK